MSYDRDLNPVLELAANEQLQPIVDVILKASISESLSHNPKYQQYAPQHNKYADVIADEIRLFGGHTLVNLFRKEGPSYFEIVKDVAKKLKVKFLESDSIDMLEKAILIKLLQDMLKKFTPEQVQQLKSESDYSEIVRKMLQEQDFDRDTLDKLTPSAFVLATTVFLSTAARLALVGGLGTAAAASAAFSLAGGRLLGLLGGPLAWGATIAYSAYELGGEAYRVTVPCVLNVALIRLYQRSSVTEKLYFDYLSKRKLPYGGTEQEALPGAQQEALPGSKTGNESKKLGQGAAQIESYGKSEPILTYEEFRAQLKDSEGGILEKDAPSNESSRSISSADEDFLRTTIKTRH